MLGTKCDLRDGAQQLVNGSDMDGSSPTTVITRLGWLYERYGMAFYYGMDDNME